MSKGVRQGLSKEAAFEMVQGAGGLVELWAEGIENVKGRTEVDMLKKQQGEWLVRKESSS